MFETGIEWQTSEWQCVGGIGTLLQPGRRDAFVFERY